MPVKLLTPGPQGLQQTTVVTSASTTGGGIVGGIDPGTSGNEAVADAITNLSTVLSGKTMYESPPNSRSAPDEVVSGGLFIDPDVRQFANSLSITGHLLVRTSGYMQIYGYFKPYGIVKNYSIIKIGLGA